MPTVSPTHPENIRIRNRSHIQRQPNLQATEHRPLYEKTLAMK